MRQRGFTLIEVLIAMSILAFIVTLTWQTFGSNMRAKERWEARNQFNESVSLVLGQMSEELASAFVLSSNAPQMGRSPSGEVLTRIIFRGEDSGDEDSLAFVSFSNFRYFKDVKESDQSEISYKLERNEGERGGMNLVKRSDSPPDENIDEGKAKMVLLEGVTELNFRFYDSKKREWMNDWNSESMDALGKLPRAVEIRLKVKPEDVDGAEKASVLFSTIALLELAPGPSDF